MRFYSYRWSNRRCKAIGEEAAIQLWSIRFWEPSSSDTLRQRGGNGLGQGWARWGPRLHWYDWYSFDICSFLLLVCNFEFVCDPCEGIYYPKLVIKGLDCKVGINITHIVLSMLLIIQSGSELVWICITLLIWCKVVLCRAPVEFLGFHSIVEPNERQIDKKAGRLIAEFKDQVFPDGYVPGARKRVRVEGVKVNRGWKAKG